jgi:hypothetical protein
VSFVPIALFFSIDRTAIFAEDMVEKAPACDCFVEAEKRKREQNPTFTPPS